MTNESSGAKPSTLLTSDQERELVAAYQRGSRAALEALVTAHVPLVRSIARRYRGHARHDDDLVAEGRLGLLQAAARFEPERGVRFAVYAAWWVRAFVRRFALDNRRIVRAPSTRIGRKLASKLPVTVQRLRQARGREVTDEEIARELGASPEDVAAVRLALSTPDLMLEDEVHMRNDGLVDPLPSPEAQAAEHEQHDQLHHRVREALNALSTREREIVSARYLEDDGATLATLGVRLGISRERVRQLEARARNKLRDQLVDVA